jgi:hypothetical protein
MDKWENCSTCVFCLGLNNKCKYGFNVSEWLFNRKEYDKNNVQENFCTYHKKYLLDDQE